jgi:hypothetical protein
VDAQQHAGPVAMKRRLQEQQSKEEQRNEGSLKDRAHETPRCAFLPLKSVGLGWLLRHYGVVRLHWERRLFVRPTNKPERLCSKWSK